MEISNPQANTFGFDVFLSHNSKEKDFVRKIKEDLGLLGVKAWLDVDDLPLGPQWQPELEKGLRDSRMVAVFIGPVGMGNWQTAEMQVAINHSVTKNKPLIPVLLPGGPEPKELTEFLQLYSVADFRMGYNPIELKRLAEAITGKKLDLLESISNKAPEPSSPSLDGDDEKQDPSVQRALEYFEEAFDSVNPVNITFFIGQGISHSGLDSVISPQKISRELMKNLQLIDQDYSQLLPAIDTSSAYYAMSKSDSALQNAVAKQLWIAPDTNLPVYQKLSSLLALVGKREPRRGQHISPQVVVTSNFDLLLERCLLRAGLSFTRLVQYRASPQIDINEYKNVRISQDGTISVDCAGSPSMQVNVNDTHAMDDLIATCNKKTLKDAKEFGASQSLSLSSLSSPIIYKINGSCDVSNSCIMTIDQHLDFIWRQSKQSLIPDQINEIIKNTPILFIGSRILDPDFRLGYLALLQEETKSKSYDRYALLAKPKDGDLSDCGYRMLSTCWDPIKDKALERYEIKVIDVSNEKFLELLRQRLAGVIGV